MLAFLRQRKRSWVIVFFVAIIVLVFVLWGVGSYVNEPGSESPAEVNGEKITPAEFEFHYQRVVQQYRNLLKESFNEDTLRSMNLRGMVLQELIQKRLLLQEARKLGIATSDEELKADITRTPDFQTNGVFDQNRYVQTLRANRLTPAQFEAERRVDLTLQKLYALAGDAVMVTEKEAEDRFRFEQERVNLYYTRLSVEPFLNQVKITDDEIKEYYQQNREAIKQPLKVQVEYIEYPIDRFAAKVQVSDQDIEEFYKKHQQTKFHRPKSARLRQIFFRAPQGTDAQQKELIRVKAETILREAQQGKDFAQLAKSFSEDPSAADGGDIGLFSEGQMLEALDRAAFALKKGQVSGLIETPIGYHILKAEDTGEPKTRNLAEVRAEIIGDLRKEKGKIEADRAVSADRETALSGTPLSQLADSRGLSAATTGLFDQFEVVQKVGPVEEFNRAAFSLASENEISPVVEARHAYYLLKLQKRREPAVPPLPEVQAQVERALRQKKAAEVVEQKAKEVLSQLKEEKDIRLVAKTHDLAVEETGLFPRGAPQIPGVGPLEDLPRGGIALSAGQPVSDRAFHGSGGLYLLSFKESAPADMQRFPEEKKAFLERMLAEKRQQAMQKFLADLTAKAQIVVRNEWLQAQG
jgi:peptidyl-prolyl cis-trans isomerase D